ncbi:unnamed protein product [Closterium sp. NIES-54]
MVTTTTPGGPCVMICTCTRTGRHLATFTRRPGSSQVAASCSYRLLSHQTLLWHHRLGHPSLPRLRGMHSRLLVSCLPMSLPPLPPSPAPPCLPCIEGRQRAAPHSSFPPTTAPLQNLHMDVKGQVVDVMIPWIRRVRLQLHERFGQDLPVLRLHSDRGGEFSSSFLRDFCHGEGILKLFMLPASPQKNGIVERRIGLVMEVACTSMVHAAAPHFLWPFAVRYAAHQLKLWPRVSLPVTSPTLHWTGEVGDASVFRVWGSRAFVRDTTADKLSPRAIPCVFLGFVPDAPGWQFYHPTSRRVFPSQDVMFDESVPFYRLFPYRSAPPLPPPLFLAPGPLSVDPLLPQGPAPSGVSQVEPLPGPAPVQVAVGSGAARGAASGGAQPGGAQPGGAGSEGAEIGGAEPGGVETGVSESGGAEPEGVEPEGVEPGGAALEGAESGGAEPQGAASSGGSAGASPRLSRQQLPGGAGVAARAGVTGGTAATGPGGARTWGTGVAGTCSVEVARAGGAGGGGTGAGGAGVGGSGIGGAGVGGPGSIDPSGTVRPRPYASRPVLPVRTALRVPRSHPPPPVPGTHAMTLRPSSVPDPESDRARAGSPTVSRLLATAATDSFQSSAASALVVELLDFAAACRLDYASTLVAESAPASPPSVRGDCALGTDVLEDSQEDFECLAAAVPRFASMLLAPEGDPDAPDIPTPRSYVEAITALHEEIWLRRPPGFTGSVPAGTQCSLRRPVYGLRQAPREWNDTLKTTLAALGFAPSTADPSLFLRTDTSLPPFYILVYVDGLVFATADIEALTLVKSELQKRHICTDLGELRSYLGLQITRDMAWRTITLTQSHMVHQVLQRFGFQLSLPQPTPLSTSHSLSAPPLDESVEPSGPYPELVGCLMYLMTCRRPDLAYPLSLLARYVAPGRHRKVHWDAAKRVLRYLCSTSRMEHVLGGRGPVVLTGHADASWVDDSATQRSSQGYTFSFDSGSVSWRTTRSSSVLSSSCEAEIYARAMAAQELRWLTYVPTDLGEKPCLPPVLYVDNKAMIALCQERRTKHITLRYFLTRALQQLGQLRLAYVATRANTADIFTKALPPGDHQRSSTVLGLDSDIGGEFSSDLLQGFCHGEGILQSFKLPASPQQNGIAERCIGLVIEVARTSMIHAAAPRFLWPFAVRYAAHQLNLLPRVSLPETSPTLRWTGKVGDASVFQVWGSRAFVRDTSADKLSSRAIPRVFLGIPPDAPGWQFYHPTSRRVLPFQDVRFDKSVPFYRLFPYPSAPLPPPPLFLAPSPPPVDPLPPQGPAPSGVSRVDPIPVTVPVKVAVDVGGARGAASGGAASGGAASGGAEPARTEPGGAESEGADPGGTEFEGAESGGAEPGGAEPVGARGSTAGGTGARGTGATSLGAAGAAGPGGARTRGAGASRVGGAGAGDLVAGDPGDGGARPRGAGAGDTGPGAGGTGAGDPGAGGAGGGGAGAGCTGAGGTVQQRPSFIPPQPSSLPPPDSVICQVFSLPSSTSLTPPLLCPPPDQSQPQLKPDSPLPAPSPCAKQTDSPSERREPASRPTSPVRTVRTGRRFLVRVLLLFPALTLWHFVLPLFHYNPIVPCLLATVVTDPSFESTAASTLVAELVDFAATCRLDYATSLVAESNSDCPLSVGGERALGTDVLEDRHED